MKGLAALMARHGDTMARLADFLDVNINTVWRWKSGQNAPTLGTQRAICGRYGCADVWLRAQGRAEGGGRVR
jgi:transcriptional regulator with XRE-family HTH domain